jgi:hypothetical protein
MQGKAVFSSRHRSRKTEKKIGSEMKTWNSGPGLADLASLSCIIDRMERTR